jgi:mRNA-degrading endonuclease RelE of RelBE toxin-antitoxin system
VELARRAVRDLRRMNRPDVRRVREALDDLVAGAENLDVKAIQGHSPWRRLRVGDFRVLYRELSRREGAGSGNPGLLVARVIDRRELERAVRSLG